MLRRVTLVVTHKKLIRGIFIYGRRAFRNLAVETD